MNRLPGLTLALLIAASAVPAAELGMEAPPLKIAQWIKGEPVSLSARDGKKIYVVEFWATWCAPCRITIPHLSELQKKFKDRGVVVIGISDEKPETVKAFVEKMAGRMDYVVAVDDAEKTGSAYMKAFEIDGIPHAFVIDRTGAIAWQGHPLAGLDQVISDILDDRYDIAAARRAMEAEKNMANYFARAVEATEATSGRAVGEQILKEGAGSASLLNEFAWTILTHPRIRHRDTELAVRAARQAFEKSEGKDVSILDTYARALFVSGKQKDAAEIQRKAVEAATDPVERGQLEKTLQQYLAASKN